MERRSNPDAPPANYLPLSTAFDRFCERHQGKKLAGHVETRDEWEARLNNDEKLYRDFVDHLRMGRLRAIVCHPLTREKMPIPCDAWTSASFPERPLKAHVINGEEGEGFLAYVGRTPFVLEADVSAILNAGAEPQIKPPGKRWRYPWDKCQAAFSERVAEDGAPTIDGGQAGWRDQADVEAWIIDWMRKRTGKEPGGATARRYAREFMGSIGGGSRGS